MMDDSYDFKGFCLVCDSYEVSTSGVGCCGETMSVGSIDELWESCPHNSTGNKGSVSDPDVYVEGIFEFKISDGVLYCKPQNKSEWCRVSFYDVPQRFGLDDDVVLGHDGGVKRIFSNSSCNGFFDKYRYCERCGALNDRNQRYCGECGYLMRSMDGSVDDFEDFQSTDKVEDDDEVYNCFECQYFRKRIGFHGLKGECDKCHKMKMRLDYDSLTYSKKNCPSFRSNSEKFTVKHDDLWFLIKYFALIVILSILCSWFL